MINKEFRIVFNPKNPALYGGRTYFFVGAGSLWKYIGIKMAAKLVKNAMASKEDRYTKKLRGTGKVYFYSK